MPYRIFLIPRKLFVRRLAVLIMLLLMANSTYAEDFNARIAHINATGFPAIEAMLRVYCHEPLELNKDDLKVYENDSNITEFALTRQNFQHRMVLAIDRSSSIEKAMPDVKKAAVNLVQSLAASVSIAIVSFGSDIDINHDFSNDVNSLEKSINAMRPWGGTTLFDALYDSCEELQAAAGLNDLKTVVCLTDGHDSTPSGQERLSKRGPEEVKAFAIDKGIRVITLGLGDDIDRDFLQGLASETGGWYLQTATAEQLTQLCEDLGNRIKLMRHYRLVFNSPSTQADSKSRNLKVAITCNQLSTEASRQFHTPEQASSQLASFNNAVAMNLEELLDYFEIYGDQRAIMTEKTGLPPLEAVHGLTQASFKGLVSVDCRTLINQAQQRSAEKHQQNFNQQKSFLDKRLSVIDTQLQVFYQKADASGLKEETREKIARLIEFLKLRRMNLEYLAQKAYEHYLICFQTSVDELAYFEKTQVGSEKFDENYFVANYASQTQALKLLDSRFDQMLSDNLRKQEELFAVVASATNSDKKLDPGLPELKPIKTLD